MKTYYAQSDEGSAAFYVSTIHGDRIPANAVEISDEERIALLAAETNGGIIVPGPDGVPIAVDPPPQTLDQEKAQKLSAINAECDRRINAEVLSYPSTEVLTFPKQESEARAWTADSAAPTPLIDALAGHRGIDKAELAARIIAKADYFADYTGKMVGYRQKLEDQVLAASTAEELDAIDPLAGWPE